MRISNGLGAGSSCDQGRGVVSEENQPCSLFHLFLYELRIMAFRKSNCILLSMLIRVVCWAGRLGWFFFFFFFFSPSSASLRCGDEEEVLILHAKFYCRISQGQGWLPLLLWLRIPTNNVQWHQICFQNRTSSTSFLIFQHRDLRFVGTEISCGPSSLAKFYSEKVFCERGVICLEDVVILKSLWWLLNSGKLLLKEEWNVWLAETFSVVTDWP